MKMTTDVRREAVVVEEEVAVTAEVVVDVVAEVVRATENQDTIRSIAVDLAPGHVREQGLVHDLVLAIVKRNLKLKRLI